MTDQHNRQVSVILVQLDTLAKLLNLPSGHTIERVTTTEHPLVPGLFVVARGPAMFFNQAGAPLIIERYEDFMENAQKRAETIERHDKAKAAGDGT